MTSGTESTEVAPARSISVRTAAHWSGWMSIRKAVGAFVGRSERRRVVRPVSTVRMPTTTIAPSPRATTLATVGAPGRPSAARP